MVPRIVVAVCLASVLATAGAHAACPQGKTSPGRSVADKTAKQRVTAANCVDLGSLPEISAHVVAVETAGQPAKAKTPIYVPSAATPYEGPTLTLTKPEPSARPAPTVGYHWSLN